MRTDVDAVKDDWVRWLFGDRWRDGLLWPASPADWYPNPVEVVSQRDNTATR